MAYLDEDGDQVAPWRPWAVGDSQMLERRVYCAIREARVKAAASHRAATTTDIAYAAAMDVDIANQGQAKRVVLQPPLQPTLQPAL